MTAAGLSGPQKGAGEKETAKGFSGNLGLRFWVEVFPEFEENPSDYLPLISAAPPWVSQGKASLTFS